MAAGSLHALSPGYLRRALLATADGVWGLGNTLATSPPPEAIPCLPLALIPGAGGGSALGLVMLPL